MPRSGSFLVLLDADDLACVEACAPDALSGHVLAFDLDIHMVLDELGIEHLTPWDLVATDEWEQLQAFEGSLFRFWTRHAQAPFEGIDLLSLAGYRHKAWISRMAWAAYVIERGLAKLRPSEVVVFEEPVGHGLSPPDDYNKMPVLFMLLRGMAEQHGIPVRLLAHNEQAGRAPYVDQVAQRGEEAERVFAAAVGQTSPTVGQTSSTVDQRSSLAASPAELLAGRRFVLFAGSGGDLERQLPLIRRINEQGRHLAVQLYKTAGAQTLTAMRAAGHLFWHDSQVTRGAPPVDDYGFIDDARQAFEAACADVPTETRPSGSVPRAAVSPELRSVFANPHLSPHFGFIFGPYLRKMAQQVRSWRHFFHRCRPEVLVANYFAPINDVAAHVGIPGLVLSHALVMIGQADFFASFPNFHVGAISEPHRAELLGAGFDPGRVHVTGDPRVDQVREGIPAPARVAATPRGGRRTSVKGVREGSPAVPGQEEQRGSLPYRQDGDATVRERADLRTRLGLGGRQRLILLATAHLALPAQRIRLPIIDWADAARCLTDLTRLAGHRPEWRWVVKCHPRLDQPQLYERANRTLPPDRRIIVSRDESLHQLAAAADVTVVFNVVTSALLEASFCQRPVVVLRQSMPWYHPKEWGLERWPHVASVAQLESRLEAIFNDPQHYRQEVQRIGTALKGYFRGTPPHPIASCAELIERIAHRCGTGFQPVENTGYKTVPHREGS